MWSDSRARRVPAAGRPGALRLGFELHAGMRVGLFGGSFNPAHAGHAHVAETARIRLGLDRVIWLVTPGNPLKDGQGTAPLPARMRSAGRQARGPSMIVSDAEARIGSRYTLDTVRLLKARFPGVRFVWIMGADNLLSFHAWRGWADILETAPVAVIARPGVLIKSRFAPTAVRFARARLPSRAARTLASLEPPAWVYLNARLSSASSTALRTRMRKASWEAWSEGSAPPGNLAFSQGAYSSGVDAPASTFERIRHTDEEPPLTPDFDPGSSLAKTTPALRPDAPLLEALILSRLDDDKAQDVVVIDLKGKSPLADTIIVASGRSQRHVAAMADHLLRTVKDAGHGSAAVEGLPNADWVLIDAIDVIVHLFRPEVRAFYQIEKIWSVEPPGRSAAANP